MGGAECSGAVTLPTTNDVSDHEAMYYEKLDEKKIRCQLCPKECRVADGERGYCGVRENVDGVYRSFVYGRPLFPSCRPPLKKNRSFIIFQAHRRFPIATAGCNIECKFCQNWDISQFRPEQVRMIDLPPAETVQLAYQTKSQSIAYTYSEPVIFYEYMRDTAIEARKKKIGSVMISNGYIQEKPLRELVPNLTGIKIDFKGYTEKFYKEICNGELKPVLKSLEIIHELKCWLELVVLIIPTLNDSDEENRDMTKWIIEHLGPDTPIHLTRFHPMYKIKNLPSTPVRTLERLRKIAQDAGANYVYIGNVPGHPAENTNCHSCGELLIRRLGYRTTIEGMENGVCKKCKTKIPGVWTDPL